MAAKLIQVRLNQQSMQVLYGGGFGVRSGGGARSESESVGSASDTVPVEYSYQDTFTTLLEKCLLALNIKGGNDSSSTKLSNDGEQHSSLSRSTVTKQALIFDKEHMLVTMLQEVKENETYFIEIIDNKMLAKNQLTPTSPMLPPQLDRNSSQSSDRGGSFNNVKGRKSSSMAGHTSSFASTNYGGQAARNSTLLSCDTDFVYNDRSKSDIQILQMSTQRQTKFKVVLVGAARSGKSSLAYRFVDRTSFLDDYEPTYIDTYEQEMNMIDPSDGLNRVVNLTIQDIGHQSLREQMLLDADAVIFCYDVTNEESFYSLSELFQLKMQAEYSTGADDNDDMAAMETLSRHGSVSAMGGNEEVPEKLRPVVLVGCKNDLSNRAVDYLDGERTAESFKAPYIECSSCTNHRVEDVFELVLIQLFKQEKAGRDKQMEEAQGKGMLNSSIIQGKYRADGRQQEDSCCTIF